MLYKFNNKKGEFSFDNPLGYNLYFPLTNKNATLLSSISPNLAGDLKLDNDHFITPPVSVADIKTNLLCRRDFFLKINNKIIRLSQPSKDKVTAGPLYHKITKQIKNISIEILNFIPHDANLEIMQVRVKNNGPKPIDIEPTSFIPLYGRGEKNLRDHRHVSSLLNRVELIKYGILLQPTMVFDEKGHQRNELIYFCLGFQGNNTAPIGQFPSLDYFCGRGDLICPDAIKKNLKPITKNSPEFNGKEALGALRFKSKTLKPKEEVTFSLLTGYAFSKTQIDKAFKKFNSLSKIKKSLKETAAYWDNYLSGINFDFGDNDFNNWLNWVRLQPTLRKLFGCSFLPHFDYGKGGRGWRDLWQDVLTLLITEPEEAKKILTSSFSGIRIDGSNATIITKEGGFISDRNSISRIWCDHGVWPWLSLKLYIDRTGNLNILNKEVAYFRDHLLKRTKEINRDFKQKDYFLRDVKSKIYKGSILEHILIQHLTSFFNVGQHNILKLENADWNDGLDMAPDKGESVAFAFMYAKNLKSLAEFLRKFTVKKSETYLLKELSLLLDTLGKPINYNHYRQKRARLDEYLEKVKNVSGEKIKINLKDLISDLEKKYNHLSSWLRKKEWLKEGFFNGYYDNKSNRCEGKIKNKLQIILPSQVFAILSPVPTKEQVKKTWASIKKHLKDKKLGGFRLNTNFESLRLDLGRAFGFSYGDKENGAFFSHMSIMLGYAMYYQGFTKEGFEVINSLYKMSASQKAQIYPGIPEYFNSQGKGLYLYLTGSASWYIYTLVEKILGLEFNLGDITLNPHLGSSNFKKDKIIFNFVYANKTIALTYLKKHNKPSYKIGEVYLNNAKIAPINNTYKITKQSLAKIPAKKVSLKVNLI